MRLGELASNNTLSNLLGRVFLARMGDDTTDEGGKCHEGGYEASDARHICCPWIR